MLCVCVLLLQKLSDCMSTSEGSTVDLRPLKERRVSIDFEMELPVDDPEACFNQGERITARTKSGIMPKLTKLTVHFIMKTCAAAHSWCYTIMLQQTKSNSFR